MAKKASKKKASKKAAAAEAASEEATPKAKKAKAPEMSVEEMIEALQSTDDQGEKRRLRARLRAAGHNGGARGHGAESPQPTMKKASKKGKRSKAAATADEE